MAATVLSFSDYTHLDTFKFPEPRWVKEQAALQLRKPPVGLNAALVKELGEAKGLIGHCIAITRMFGITVADYVDLWNAIGLSFGGISWDDAMLAKIEAHIECPGLNRQSMETLVAWEAPSETNSGAKSAYEFFRSALVARHGRGWQPKNDVLKHAVLIIEQARLDSVRAATPVS